MSCVLVRVPVISYRLPYHTVPDPQHESALSSARLCTVLDGAEVSVGARSLHDPVISKPYRTIVRPEELSAQNNSPSSRQGCSCEQRPGSR